MGRIPTLHLLLTTIKLSVSVGVLVLASQSGRWGTPLMVATLAAVGVGLLIVARPQVGLIALICAALLINYDIGTGTEVRLNVATLMVPFLFFLWVLHDLRHSCFRFPTSATTLPLLLFLSAGLLSLAIGRATWDPSVPVRTSFLLVQIAQWMIFLFSVFAFWLTAGLVQNDAWLRSITFSFLLIGGLLEIGIVIWGVGMIAERISTIATFRAPFWLLLSALAGGQLLFNRQLRRPVKLAVAAIVLMATYYAFFLEREGASTWLGIAVAGAVLVWLRFPRLHGFIVVLLILLIVLGVLFPVVYEFAGGDEEWDESGNSRLVLIGRVMEVAMRNPITGLGPAAYRPYANMKPLLYGRAFWSAPQINSHNNYVDLFAHGGIMGLALLTWFGVAYGRLGLRLHRRYPGGFTGGYVVAMLAVGAGALVIMLLADWMLPFVYNIGFHGFQASVLVWLFLGGLVAIDQMDARTKP